MPSSRRHSITSQPLNSLQSLSCYGAISPVPITTSADSYPLAYGQAPALDYLKAPSPADILIVDDTLENVLFLADLLETQGYSVRKALSGDMALRAVAAATPDLILLDICMPDLDGYEVCRLLKAKSTTAQVPIIFLSALSDAMDKVQAFDLGAVDYITKPFQGAEVLARARTHLTLRSALQAVEELNQHLEDKVRHRTHQLEQANGQLMQMAYHDTLTQLPNRALLTERLNQAITALQTDPDYQFALLFLDCDRFKLINDSFGHGAGDDLLIAIAQRLSQCLGPQDTLARFGGDEFAVLLPHLQQPERPVAIAQALLNAFTESFHLPEGEVFISASIGVVLSNATQHYRPEHTLRDADTAMYHAKANGKARFCLFNPAMQRASAKMLQIETELHQALQGQELVPYYQPIVHLPSQQPVGVEVLCRWHHPDRGLLLPHTFIPIAEETHLIVDLDTHLLEAACAQLRQWQLQGTVADDFYLSVNLSARHLSQSQLPGQIQDCLTRHHLQPHHLHIEITESSILDNDIAKAVMKQLNRQQIQLSVDDFGTGYSSLSYLHRLPVNTLKIDRSFIQEVDLNGRDNGIVVAILGIATALNLKVVSEGLETMAQLEKLRSLNCELGQGYLFSKPIPAGEVPQLLEARSWLEISV